MEKEMLESLIKKMFVERQNELEKEKQKAYNELIEAQNEYCEIAEKQQDLSKEEDEILQQAKSGKLDNFKPSFHLSKNDGFELNEDAVRKANEWIAKHELEHHTKTFLGLEKDNYKGAVGFANYELRKGWTSIGSYVELVCTECEHSKRSAKSYSFDIEELG